MASANTQSANEPERPHFRPHSTLKPTIKAQISGRMASFQGEQSSRQCQDSICSALITRELRGPEMAGCSILEFSFVLSESGA